MELLLIRDVRTTQSTTSKFFINNEFECFMLEDEDRGLKQDMPLSEIAKRKLYGNTCIPEGRYKVIINLSNRFKRLLPLLLDVPGYVGIRIHPGNTHLNTEGCLLPGTTRLKDKVVHSKLAFDRLFKKLHDAQLQNEEIFITITS